MTADVHDGVQYLGLPPSAETALATLPQPVRHWFHDQFGTPTPVQRLAWRALADGKHLLLSAPTGSGKTLAAFLPLLSNLLAPPVCTGIRGLYVAPLKALVNDICSGLRGHLKGMRPFLGGGRDLQLAIRTGDSGTHARRNLVQEPPDILLTTPESLAVLLTQPAVAELVGSLAWVVVDEVHSLATNKRGADLALSLERLEMLAGVEVQRIGLSATVAPSTAEAARFLVGTGRPCCIAEVGEPTPLELAVEPLPERNFLGALLDRLEPELAAHRSTLIFANTRGLAERVSWALRHRRPDWDQQIAVHHSALAADRRLDVEQRFKQGRLRAVVSSTSLELGIDIGSVDLVVLVHPPGGVVRLLQRVGRSGHAPARTRRGLVLAANAAELLEAAVTAASSHASQAEPLQLPSHPLDVLCQQLVGLATQRWWTAEQAFALVRRAYPYAALPRADLDACLDYLSGRHADGRSWLPSRLRWDGDDFTIADENTARLLRRNLGTILADTKYEVRSIREDEEQPDLVGQVDEAFADRLQPGERFLLDGRCLQFQRRERDALLVTEVIGRRPPVPRWGGEGLRLSAELARRLFLLRLQAAEALRGGRAALQTLLERDYHLPACAVGLLADHFERQECVSEIPGITTCLIEAVRSSAGDEFYLHTPLHQAGNDALARVLVLRLSRRHAVSVTSLVADLGLALSLRRPLDLTPEDWRGLLGFDGFDADLDGALAESVLLRERFRRVALTGLMILRQPLGRRRRVGGSDWPERRLFEQVRDAAPDFVLLRQAQREVRSDGCAADAARAYLRDLPACTMRCRWLTQPSPFVEAWTQLAAGPVESVESPTEALRRLHAALTGGSIEDERTS
jgi:ATP-dependent Lhr-like helicase